MSMHRTFSLAIVLTLIAGCSETRSSDSTFDSMQHRGEMAMGVNQYTSSHQFAVTPEGGRIYLERDADDSLSVEQIRAHMKLIQHAFQAGDFSTPAFVHQREMPGTAVMKQKRGVIQYSYEDLPRGGSVVITTSDPAARAAIAQFLEAQRTDHRTH
jgi:hypothetical protein